ncbi:MAG: hypothetical protein KKB22_00610, partial [Candidatus Omnitrophica bacterium]|nr:hypothetical protein [Candidatus Omnitrophota bacterium]
NQARFNISQRISFYEDEMPVLQYIQTEIQKQREHYLEKFCISSGDLKLFVDPAGKSVNFYYKDQLITKGYGLFSGLKIDSRPYSLSFCKDWNVIKKDVNTMRLVMTQEKCRQEEIFVFRLNAKGLSVKVGIISPVNFKLEAYYFKLEFNENYKIWETSYERSNFPSEAQTIESIMPARMIENKVDSIIMRSEEKVLPILNISTFFNPSRRIASLHKRREKETETICLQYQFSF